MTCDDNQIQERVWYADSHTGSATDSDRHPQLEVVFYVGQVLNSQNSEADRRGLEEPIACGHCRTLRSIVESTPARPAKARLCLQTAWHDSIAHRIAVVMARGMLATYNSL